MKTAIITGASRGVGRAVAETLAGDGWRLILNCRSRFDLLEQEAEKLRSVTEVHTVHGPITDDVLAALLGTPGTKTIPILTEEDLEKTPSAPCTYGEEKSDPLTAHAPQDAFARRTRIETPEDALQAAMREQEDKYIRLLAEYDNSRKRSQKEKDSLYQDAKTDTVSKILPVFDNLERAVNQPTEDEAYKKGVEMTMSGLREVMSALGVTEFGEAGDAFDPNMHNAVMHIEDESLGENVIAQVFQKGFKIGEKVVRFAMVQVAN